MASLRQALAVLTAAIGTHYGIVHVQAAGLQSGPSSGAMYAGGMFVDEGDSTLYMTGIHYNDDVEGNVEDNTFLGNAPSTSTSSCFIASMRLNLDDSSGNYDFGGVGDWRSGVNDVQQESCMALALHKPSQIVVIGTKEEDSDVSPPLEGSVSVFERNALKNKKLSETTLVDQDETMTQLVYPVAITTDSTNSDFMYLVVLASRDAKDNSAAASGNYPDWLKTQKYGSTFDMHVSKLRLTQGSGSGFDGIPTGSITASKEWTTEFPLDDPSDRVFIGGIIHKKTSSTDGLVIVVGSTRGSGPGYGLEDGNDEDGFVTVIDPSNGDILGVGAREGSKEDDIVTGVCDDPNDPNHFFVVGATEGNMGGVQSDVSSVAVPTDMLSPFLRQVRSDRDSNDADNGWTMQWAVTKGSSSAAYGSTIGCVVDGDYVYVAGTVDDGASMIQGQSVLESQGGDDVWIAKIDKNTQKVQWINQLGSDGDDRLARYGGIALDNAGNPIIYGDTSGDIYRTRSSSEADSIADMFVMSLNKNDGQILNNADSTFVGGISSNSGDDDYSPPTFYPTALASLDSTSEGTTDSPTSEDTTENPTSEDTTESPTSDIDYTEIPTSALESEAYDATDESDDEHSYIAIGLQIQGPAHAGGLVYDSKNNYAILTGATYVDADLGLNPTSLCFTGIVNLDSGDLMLQTPRGSEDQEEACNAITFDTNRNAAYAIASAETDSQGQFQTSLDSDTIFVSGGPAWESAESGAATAGLIFQMDKNMVLLGGNRVVEYPTVYPVSVVTHPLDKDYLFVASLASKSTAENASYGAAYRNYPNYLDGDSRKYGSEFFLMVDRFQVYTPEVDDDEVDSEDVVPLTLEKNWFSDFKTDGGQSVLLGGMVMAGNGNVLVVAGSTNGEGGVFDESDGRDDMDGFIVKINPEDGRLFEDDDTGKPFTRLDSVNNKDDFIFNICNDRFDHDAIFVVGKSAGHIRDLSDEDQPPQGSTHAFIAKVSLKTMMAEWLHHFTLSIPGDGIRHGEALACSVTPDSNGENIVYVGGTVKDGASMDGNAGSTQAYGKDDIFVASMNGGTGSMNWIQQIGTSADDSFAKGQGLEVDSFGNAIVYAETMGNFYDEHKSGPDATDLVVLTINKLDGTYLTPRTAGPGVGDDEGATAEVAEMTIPSPPRNGIPAIQTFDDEIPSYAGGMHYDPFTNAIFLTGASYTEDDENVSKSSQCLFGVVTLPQLQWKQKNTFGTSNTPEACSSISLASYRGKSEAILVGSSEKSGLLDNLRNSRKSSQYGMVLDMQNNGGSFDLVGGTVVDEEKVQFPVKVIGDNEQVYLVSMASKSDEVQSDSGRADGKKYPNFTMGGIEKYGKQYEILIERHTLNRGDDIPSGSSESTMTLDWRKPLETADKRSIFVSGMAVIDDGDALIVVGSTQGAKKDDDFDGIMAKISTDAGSFASEGDESRSVAYFSSISGANDWILSVCRDVDDERFFYVTGATGGVLNNSVKKGDDDVTVHAVVSKIQTDTLNIIWTTQYEVTHADGSTDKEAASVALGCAVVPGGGYLYVAGDVENGAILEGATESAGGDDIFVAMLDTETGNKIWTEQVGSSGDDRIARGGGIVADENGDAVVFGDTTGSLFRMRDSDSSQTSDLFLMVFNQKDGSHENSMTKLKSNKKNTSAKSNPTPSEWFGTNYNTDSKVLGMIAGVIVAAVLLIISCCVLYRRTRSRHEMAKQNSIFTYLQQFSVEDIDLRKSPPGGWHGTYLNKLAHGVNTRASLPETQYRDEHVSDDDDMLFDQARMVHSGIIGGQDSLFMDTTTEPTLGGFGSYSDAEELTTRKKKDGLFANPV